MSLYYFIAGERKMRPFSLGIEKKGSLVIIENEKRLLNIYEAAPSSCTKPYTELSVIMGVELGLDFSTVAQELLSYIQAVMAEQNSITLWSVWIGKVCLGDRETERRSVAANELTVEDLCWIFGEMAYSHPKCLKVYKWTKGKR